MLLTEWASKSLWNLRSSVRPALQPWPASCETLPMFLASVLLRASRYVLPFQFEEPRRLLLVKVSQSVMFHTSWTSATISSPQLLLLL